AERAGQQRARERAEQPEHGEREERRGGGAEVGAAARGGHRGALRAGGGPRARPPARLGGGGGRPPRGAQHGGRGRGRDARRGEQDRVRDAQRVRDALGEEAGDERPEAEAADVDRGGRQLRAAGVEVQLGEPDRRGGGDDTGGQAVDEARGEQRGQLGPDQ